MAMEEILLSALFSGLLGMLNSPEVGAFATQLSGGVNSELNKLQETLEIIEALLNDAENRQQTDAAVKVWLDKLQDWAYDAEDILDEFSYEALRQELNSRHPACMPNFSPCSIRFNFHMWKQLRSITSQLERLCQQKNDLGLRVIPVGASNVAPPRPLSTSLKIESAIYGREKDKTKILEMVLRDEPRSDANFDLISIVGMGGLGKTTLAREVFNDKAVDKFDIKAWACVSDNFDVLRVSKALLESICPSLSPPNELNNVQIELKKAVDGKKFLLVLDDLWNVQSGPSLYDLWRILKSPFMDGALGSKIIVTTREPQVASLVGTAKDYQHTLEILPKDDCWLLFKKHAFEGDRDADQIPESIREKVIEKCEGLPLAAITLAGVLRTVSTDEANWNYILDSKFLKEIKDNVLPALRLSYHYLPPHLKRCFAFCAIFPKDYEFDEIELILLWMAEGFILHSSQSVQLEDLGKEYLLELVSRGIFQQSGGSYSKFVIHDLVHDLAQLVSENTIFRFEEANHQPISIKVRHVSYRKKTFEVFHKFEHLRTFIPLLMHKDDGNYIPSTVLFDLLPKFKKLRVLSLAGSYITHLPESVGGMRHLRYLNFSRTLLQSLPESTTSLFNLQTLILKGCYRLETLPANMRHLVNLRYLDVSSTSLEKMPLGMKELKNLRILSNFIVSKDSESNLEDLRSLKFLRRELHISELENILDLQATKRKVLCHHKDLKVLSLFWSYDQFDNSSNEVKNHEDVLDMLQPHRNLEELTITNYGGIKFPSWFGDPFSKMVVLNLEDCDRCETLTSLGMLGALEKLSIKGMTSLKHLNFEIYGDCLEPFKSSKSLYFENLQDWESWETKRFSCLRELSVVKCPKLTGKLPDYLPSLESLVIRECAELVVSFSSFPILCNLKINGCKSIEYTGSPMDLKSLNSMNLSNVSNMRNWLKQGFYQVKSLSIVNSEELIYLWQNITCVEKPLQVMQRFTSLEELCIDNCTSFDMFPGTSFLPNLKSLKILNCKVLKSLPEGILHNNASVESLEIKGCDSLTFIVGGMLPSSLKELSVHNCEKLQYLVDDKEDICASSSSSSVSVMHDSFLEKLYISDCPSLTCISTRGELPMSLKYLGIWSGPKLESITERFDYNMCLKYMGLYYCEKLKSIPEGLHNLRFLENIRLWRCSSVVSLPKEGLPDSIVSVGIHHCEKLEALPGRMHNFHSFQKLEITGDCQNIASFPAEGLPTNLTTLEINGDLKIYKLLIEWGLHNLTSLQDLNIHNCGDAVCFPQEEMRMKLPISLKFIRIYRFPNLKYLCPTSFQSLSSLEALTIGNCPELTSLSEVQLPSSLLHLLITECPLLKIQRKGDKGKKWSNIAHIPRVHINGKNI